MKTQAAQKHDNCYVVACPPVYGAARRRTLCSWPIIRQCSLQCVTVVRVGEIPCQVSIKPFCLWNVISVLGFLTCLEGQEKTEPFWYRPDADTPAAFWI